MKSTRSFLSLLLLLWTGTFSSGEVDNAINIHILISNGKTQKITLKEVKENTYSVTENVINLNEIGSGKLGLNSNGLQLLEDDFTKYENAIPYNTIDNNLMRAFYNLRDKFTTGIPELNLPILDPYKTDNVTTNLKNLFINAKIRLNDVNVVGLKDVEVSHITLKLIGLFLNFEFTLKQLVIDGKYNVKGQAMKIIPFSNNGDLRVDIDDIKVIGSTKISIKNEDKTLFLEKFDVNILNGDIKVHLNPAGKILGWILKSLVQSMTAVIAEKQKQKLEDELKSNVWIRANETLSKYTLDTLLDELSKTK